MPHRPSYPGGARSLAAHLDRLGQLLDTLGERLREGVARAVGETVALSVTGALRDALGQRETPTYCEYNRRQQGWYEERDDGDYWPHRDRYEDEPDYDDDVPAPRASQGEGPELWARWRLVLALACQAAAWWLRRLVPRYPVGGALGVGLTSALAA